VLLPAPDASLWIENVRTCQTGTSRVFISPPLGPGNYTYTVRAAWTEEGRQVTREKTVKVRPGQEVVVDFTAPEARAEDRPLTPPLAPEPGGEAPAEDRPLTPPLAPEPKG
jgi:uncharacterized protein (TIGR03000 family)